MFQSFVFFFFPPDLILYVFKCQRRCPFFKKKNPKPHKIYQKPQKTLIFIKNPRNAETSSSSSSSLSPISIFVIFVMLGKGKQTTVVPLWFNPQIRSNTESESFGTNTWFLESLWHQHLVFQQPIN
jgi:hypothetical protein